MSEDKEKISLTIEIPASVAIDIVKSITDLEQVKNTNSVDIIKAETEKIKAEIEYKKVESESTLARLNAEAETIKLQIEYEKVKKT